MNRQVSKTSGNRYQRCRRNHRGIGLSGSFKYRTIKHQQGASLIEFSIVGLSVVLIALFTLQLGLVYHAKTTLNYAVFEAARSGAVHNGSISAIRTELGMRLAPLEGGDGSEKRALLAIVKSSLRIKDPLNTRVVVLNPTKAAFRDWAIRDPETGERFIPVNHLRHQSHAVGKHSGLSLRDANILKLQVTHGFDLHVPVVGKLMTTAMRWIDAGNAEFYLRGKWPLQSVATVRMQSNSLESVMLSRAVDGGAVSGDGSGSGGSSPTLGGGSSGVGGIGVADAGGNTEAGNPQSDPSEGAAENPGDGVGDGLSDVPDNTVAQNESNAGGQGDGVSGDVATDCSDHYVRADMQGRRVKAVHGVAALIKTSEFRQMLAQGAMFGVATQVP